MKITIENTDKFITVDGVPARVWEGKSDGGIEVVALITRLAVPKDVDAAQFERELKECKVPTMAHDWPLRMFLD